MTAERTISALEGCRFYNSITRLQPLAKSVEERYDDGWKNGREMAGTNQKKTKITGGPAVILVDPQLGENIGTAARAMYNFGLTDLRLVNPRDGWPNERARSASSGALAVIDGAKVCGSTAEALADLSWVAATTARPREQTKPVMSPEEAVSDMMARQGGGTRLGLMFGRERSGLHNDDVARANILVTYPVNPAFASLNLAMAVLLFGYEWFKAAEAPGWGPNLQPEPAPQRDLEYMFEHLEKELDTANFLLPPEKRPGMIRNIRSIFLRAGLTEQEVRTMRGVITALADFRPSRFERKAEEDG